MVDLSIDGITEGFEGTGSNVGFIYDSKKDKKIDVVTAFLSVLELSRLKHVDIEQNDMLKKIKR